VVTEQPSAGAPGLVIVVDVANVMGARPDGWWRDRAGAALRLCRQVDALAGRGVPEDRLSPDQPPGEERRPPGELAFPRYVLVLEGRARDAAGRIGALDSRARIVQAPGSGDDTIVAESAAAAGDSSCLVVTADRELRQRCRATGAAIRGPGWLLDLL
jgi:8-oxo-dGTP diphosphatase